MFCAYTQAAFGRSIPDTFQHQIQRTQWYAGPLAADRAKKPMLYRIPLGCTSGIMAKRDFNAETVGQVFLDCTFEKTRAAIVASTRISQYQQFVGIWIMMLALRSPPVPDCVGGKIGSVARGSHVYYTVIAGYIINAVWCGYAFGVLPKIVRINFISLASPADTLVGEIADKLFFLSINAYNRQPGIQEFFALLGEVSELLVAVWMRRAGEAFAIGLERKPFFLRSFRTVTWLIVWPRLRKAFASGRKL